MHFRGSGLVSIELRCFRRFGPGVLAQCIGSGVGSGVGSRVGLVVGLGVFDGRDDNVFMTDTKQKQRTKKGFTKTSGGPYEGRFGFPI